MELTGDKSAPHIRVMDDYLTPIIQNVIKRNERDMDAGTEKKDPDEDIALLDHLVRLTSDPAVLHDEILDIMIAGRDAITTALTVVVSLLTQHHKTLHRLREEILRVVGPTRHPTCDDVRDMKFLQAVINGK